MRMDIRRWDPFRELADLQQGINDVFESTRRRAGETTERVNWAPPCDVYEDENEIKVFAELPGFTQEDIDLEVTGDALTISGERKWQGGDDENAARQWVRVERPYGRFCRTFSINIPVDVQNVKANYRDGVLTVSLPKSEQVKPKKINVEAG